MPTFGLVEEDYEGDENAYVGHKDLFLKRFAFPTIKPLDKAMSTAIHASLSRILREKHLSLGKKDLGSLENYSTSHNTSNCFATIKALESKLEEGTCSTENIADYYIRKAWDRFEEEPVEKTVEVSPARISRRSANVDTDSRNGNGKSAQDICRVVLPGEIADTSDKQFLKILPSVTHTQPSSSLEKCYIAEMKLAETCDKAKKHMEEDKEQKNLRILTKRTVIEKITVETKKTASEQGICAVADFFCKLFTGAQVNGYGDKPLQLPTGDPVRYAYVVAIESYLGIVERDPPLVHVISQILVRICEVVPDFESVLLGKLMRSSQLLTLDEEKCTAFAKYVAATEDRRFTLVPETSAIKLFINLHIIGLSSKNTSHFTEKALWNIISLLINGERRTLATSAMLLELVEAGNAQLMHLYPQKWRESFSKITSTLVPSLQDDVNKSDISRSIGEDIIVSNLRHAVMRCSSTVVSAM